MKTTPEQRAEWARTAKICTELSAWRSTGLLPDGEFLALAAAGDHSGDHDSLQVEEVAFLTRLLREFPALLADLEEAERMIVTNVILDFVYSENFLLKPVYAQSIEEVHDKLAELTEKLEAAEAGMAAAYRLVDGIGRTANAGDELIAKLRTELAATRQQLVASDAALLESRANDREAMRQLAETRQQLESYKADQEENIKVAFDLQSQLNETRQQLASCTRSHPHEDMSPLCELRTEIARLKTQLAQRDQQLAEAQARERDLHSYAMKLALDAECLLLDCTNNVVVSGWMAPLFEAINNVKQCAHANDSLALDTAIEQARAEELDWCYAQVEALLNDAGLPIVIVLDAIRARNEKREG